MLEKLSKEQESLMYKHRSDFIDFIVNNGKYQPKDLQLSKELRDDINWVYTKSGLEKPKFIFYSGSYLEEKLMINMIYQVLGSENVIMNQVRDQVSNQVRDQVYNQVWDQVWSQVRSQVRNQVRDQVYNQVRDQVWSQVWSQVWNQVENQVRDQVNNQVWDQVWDQVWSQVWNQVENQVYNQVRNQVDNQVYDQVRDQVRNQVNNQVSDQVRNQVWNQVDNQVYDQVRDQVWNQVSDQVWNQVYNHVKSKKLEWVEQGFGLPWNSGWFSFYTFFKEIGIVSSPDFDRYFQVVKDHGLWSIQYFKDWCIVTQLPKIIRRDNENRLHSIDAPTIEWRNGQKDYYIHGVYFPSELWENVISGIMPAKEVLKIENMEQRQAALSVISLEKILKEVGAERMDINIEKKLELYTIDGSKFNIDDEDIKIIHYFCPSTGREYFDFIPDHIQTAVEGMCWKFGFENIKDYIENMEIET